jgi:hypothetical protein
MKLALLPSIRYMVRFEPTASWLWILCPILYTTFLKWWTKMALRLNAETLITPFCEFFFFLKMTLSTKWPKVQFKLKMHYNVLLNKLVMFLNFTLDSGSASNESSPWKQLERRRAHCSGLGHQTKFGIGRTRSCWNNRGKLVKCWEKKHLWILS